MRISRFDPRSNREILLDLERRFETLERILIIMAEDFSKLTAAVDTVVTEITAVVQELQNPATDNNNQSTIDSLTSRLETAAASLASAVPAGSSTGSGSDTSGATGGDSTGGAPADGSQSSDVTPS
jgi:hypothetical protein